MFVMMENNKINRLKSVLADRNKTSKWLAEQLGKDRTTVSKWCTNTTQPPLETLVQIAQLLKADVSELVYVPRTE